MTRPAILILASLVCLAGCGTGPNLVVPTPRATDYSEASPIAVHAVSQEEVFVVGAAVRAEGVSDAGLPEGLILGSTNGGKNWRRLAYAGHDLGGIRFTALHFHDRLRGWVGGIRTLRGGVRSVPVVFITEDGGNRWREVELLQDPGSIPTSVHRIRFESARRGQLAVDLEDPETGQAFTTVYGTTDAGRTWTVLTHRGVLIIPEDRSVSWTDSRQTAGFRLRQTRLPGVSVIEATNSGGADWAPRSRINVADMDSWWGGEDVSR